jgi:hypothetical protein
LKSKNKQPPLVKIVTLDIETAPLQSYHWGMWQQNINLSSIQDEWTILSFSAKWLHEPAKKIIYRDTGGRGPDKVRDDLDLLKDLWDILNEADIVITQNGISFDIKKINSRMLMNNFPPYSPIKTIDTKVVAKKHFSFTSNKLQWMSEHLTRTKKSEHKSFPGFELWSECLKDNPRAWAEMKKYNCIDTLSTEELYLKMRPWIEGHPSISNYSDKETIACPKCDSNNVVLRGYCTTQTGKYKRYVCKDCGGWSRTRFSLNTKNKSRSLLSN